MQAQGRWTQRRRMTAEPGLQTQWGHSNSRGMWSELAGEDSYLESWIGVCRLCFAHGIEAEADINIDPRDVEDGCYMSKLWRGPNGLVYSGGQFSSGESPARPGGGEADQQSEAVRIAATWGPDVAAAER